jgi:HEAT repeat protein
VFIAGALKLVEASGPLANWISAEWGPGTTSLGQTARLEDKPAAKALAEIGDPALPSLVEVLNHGGPGDREEAVLVLAKIHTSAARRALERLLGHEQDPTIRRMVRQMLTSWEARRVEASGVATGEGAK